MYPCPQCELSFTSQDAVVSHLNRSPSCRARWASVVGEDSDSEEYSDDSGFDPLDDLDTYEFVNYHDTGSAQSATSAMPVPPAYGPPPTVGGPVSHAESTTTHPKFIKAYHPQRSGTHGRDLNLLERLDGDKYADIRRSTNNYHYPFESDTEWEVVQWITRSSLTQQDIDAFLKLKYVCDRPFSFKSARNMRGGIELLPTVPQWQHTTIAPPSGYKPKSPIVLFWRNPLEVVAQLFSNPIFASCYEHCPYKLFVEGSRDQVFHEFMSSEFAWNYHTKLPPGHELAGIVLASDKTPLTIGTGNREMHPVLLSLANIDAGVRMKATSRAFALIAYLPIVSFHDATDHDQSVLKAQLFHSCLNTILEPLKIAERHGVKMADTEGEIRTVHTPLVAWISDYPEQQLLAGVASNQSPITTASIKEFGDPNPHQPRTRNYTLSLIDKALAEVPLMARNGDGNTLEPFWKACHTRGLNGVTQPIWKDWGEACPSIFLPHDALHGLHKFFYDHVVKWVINIITGPELDKRLQTLQRRLGVRHWASGVSKLKQVTGREHRELEKVIIAAINGAVHPDVMRALRAIVDFIFQSQNIVFYGETFHALDEALREFHHFKSSIITAGGRRGKKGVINHFQIPKLEMLQTVTRTARLLGAPYQWTSDTTERCHITHVKTPYRMSNKRNFHEQCVRYMDRKEKMEVFGLYTALKHHGASLLNEMVTEANTMVDHYPEQTWLSHVLPKEELSSQIHIRNRATLFDRKPTLITDDEMTAIYTNLRPHIKLPLDQIAIQYGLPDLYDTLKDYFDTSHSTTLGGSRRSHGDFELPFSSCDVWLNLRIQQRSYQDQRIISPSQTVQALPPSVELPHGRCHTVLVAGENGNQTFSVNGGCYVAQIRVIIRPIYPNPTDSSILTYCQPFRCSSAHIDVDSDGTRVYAPAPNIDMFHIQRRLHSNKTRMGAIIPINRILQVVDLVPKHGKFVDPNLTSDNSLEGNDFYINNFSNKENFHAILSYQ